MPINFTLSIRGAKLLDVYDSDDEVDYGSDMCGADDEGVRDLTACDPECGYCGRCEY